MAAKRADFFITFGPLRRLYSWPFCDGVKVRSSDIVNLSMQQWIIFRGNLPFSAPAAAKKRAFYGQISAILKLFEILSPRAVLSTIGQGLPSVKSSILLVSGGLTDLRGEVGATERFVQHQIAVRNAFG